MRRFAGVILFLIVGVVLWVASWTKSKDATVMARDGSCQVVLPLNWVARERDDTAVLKVGVPTEDALFMVLRYPKADRPAEETYRDQGRLHMDKLRTSPAFDALTIAKGPTDLTVNGRPAVQYEIEASLAASRIKCSFLITVVDGEKSFFRLVGTLFSSETALHRAALEQVTNSFTELK